MSAQFQSPGDSQDSARSIGQDIVSTLKRTFIPVVLPVLAMWVLFIISTLLGGWINRQLGLIPRDLGGALGIIFMPLLHANFTHIIGNSISWLFLGGAVSMLTRRFALIMIAIWLLSGSLLWLFGPPWTPDYGFSRHIGASALTYGFAAFVVAFGWFSRRIWAMIIGIIVLFFNGLPMLLGMIPVTAGSGVSWFGHLSGAIAGVTVAFFFTKQAREQRRLAQEASSESAGLSAPMPQLSDPTPQPGRRQRNQAARPVRKTENDDDGELDYSKFQL